MPSLIDNYQSSVTLTETIAEAGIFPSGGSNAGMTIGMFHTYGFNFGLVLAHTANGQLVNINTNTALFALIGTTYGGDGVTTFALPDLGGRVSMGQGTGLGLSPLLLGQTPGTAMSLITQPQLPPSLGGTGSPVDEDQPGLGVRYLIRTDGIFPSNGGGGTSLGFIGSVVKYAGNFTPGSYLECAGQLLDIGLYTTLFQIIGTTYGGDGVTNFALPDLRGRSIVGAGGSHFVGEVFGQENVTITQANLPVDMGGSGIPVDNQEPSLVMNYAIALQGLFPSRDGGGADPDTPMVGEIIAFAGNYPPGGFALCQGQLLPINQNTALFSLLGTQFGGNGTTNFALPDLRGRAVLGSDAVHLTGEIFGSDQIVLTRDSIPDLNYSGGNGDETLYGGNGNDTIHGQGGSDTIISHNGNDSLDGGAGADTLTGGLGNDTYYVDTVLDSVNELAGPGSGQDYIFSSVSYTTAANVERLYLTGSANINATGRAAQNDILVGNSGNNVIDGLSGNDVMRGGLGNDTYYVDHAADTTDEVNGGGGVGDYVYSSVSYTAAAGIERLYLTGSGNINATGRAAQNDILVGNSGNNVINGLSGNDLMRGGLGNDTYYVDSTLDTVDEVTGGGTGDYVYASASFTASQGIERLYLTGSAAINATGRDAQNDILGGNSGANSISGLTGNDVLIGGLGNDMLTGGAGLDIFRFDTGLNAATNMDTVTDFVAAADTIQLENAIFTALTVTGTLAAGAFNTGTAATQSDDRIIYNTATGALLYDADGLGGAAGIQFALLSTHPAGVSAADFLVY